MKEYCIYNIWNGGSPFISFTYTTFDEAYYKLLEIIELEKQRNRFYYVDNDFYENIYPPNMKKCKIFSIKQREVGEWIKYKKEIKYSNSNLIYFTDFIDKKRGI